MKLLNKILVANRGEIAVRIIKTLRKMGIPSVAVYSWHDRSALHVRLADEAYELGGNEIRETYLDISKIINIARQAGADGIHPGYGFLSENAEFSRASADAGINFIGPTDDVIRRMGDKILSRKTVREFQIPIVEGFEGSITEILQHSNHLIYPLLVKPSSGGGGKGMRIVQRASELKEILEISSREARNYFGNDILYIERFIQDARHIEVQILADHYGNCLILGERECSVQRRYQKVIEESPAVSLSGKTRESIFKDAAIIVDKISYNNAGTLEFLVDPGGNHYFLEMNTRIQVEHPVTEMVTGIDIVELQIQVAAGNELTIKQNDIQISGHAIEARIYAEDPERDFLPSPGKIELYHEPRITGLRIDSGVDGIEILHPEYDPLIAKVIFYASSREEAINGLNLSLRNFVIHGPKTNREFLREVLMDEDFIKNKINTGYLETVGGKLSEKLALKKAEFQKLRILAAWLGWKLKRHENIELGSVWNQIGYWRLLTSKSVILDQEQLDVFVKVNSPTNIMFSFKGDEYEINIKSRNKENFIFELDGIWSSAFVSRSYTNEDIISIEGMEFKIKPLEYLPDQAWFTEPTVQKMGGLHIIKSPLHGKISGIITDVGKRIKKGDYLFSLDAMKIENRVTSPFEGKVKDIHVKEGDQVIINQAIIVIDANEM